MNNYDYWFSLLRISLGGGAQIYLRTIKNEEMVLSAATDKYVYAYFNKPFSEGIFKIF